MTKQFLWGFGAALTGVALAWLLGIAFNQENDQMEKLARLHAAELSTCWSEVEESGGTCRIEYLRDRTNTIYGAKVIREVK